jgi:hypothetical protein
MSLPEDRAKAIFLNATEIKTPMERQAHVKAECRAGNQTPGKTKKIANR